MYAIPIPVRMEASARERTVDSHASKSAVTYAIAVERSLYFKTTHGTKKMWSYVAGGLKIKVI